MKGIIRIYLFEAYNSVVARILVQAYGKMNQEVGYNNHFDKSGGGGRLVRPFTRNELW